MSTLARTVRIRVGRLLDVPARTWWPWALPGAPTALELRWRLMLRRAPVMAGEEHAARVGVGELEEVVGCSLCGDRRVQPLFAPSARARRRRGRWAYHVVRCPSCGFLYRHPGIRPERLGELYADRYGRFLGGGYERDRVRRYRLVMDAFAPVFAAGAGRRLLDFGCGRGLFLEEADARGFEPYGVDLSAESVEAARRAPSGRHAHVGAPLDVPEIAAGGFDVVTLWSVLAHLATPVEDLRTLRGLLTPQGVLLVLTVNASSLALKAHRDAWNGFTPNHLKFYSPATLPALLRQAGFGAVAFRPAYGDSLEAGTASMSARNQRRVRRAVERGNRGNMMRALAFADVAGPERWGFTEGVVRL